MRSIISVIMTLSLLALAACSGSGSSEVRSAIRSESAKAASAEKLGTAYMKGCVKALSDTIPEIQGNPMAIMQLLQYCSRTAGAALGDLKNEHQATILGCVRTLINNNGVPSNDGQTSELAGVCDKVVASVEGVAKKVEAAQAPSGSPSPEAESK